MKNYICTTCGAERKDGDNCAVAPFTAGQDCRWYFLTPPARANRDRADEVDKKAIDQQECDLAVERTIRS